MPPVLAFIFCIAFIFIIFRMDFRRHPEPTNALWIPLLWMLIIGSRLVSQWLNVGTAVSQEALYMQGNPIDKITFSILEISALVILYKRQIDWSQIVRRNLWIVLFFSYCGISILWSDFPSASLRRWVKEFGNVLMIVVILTDSSPPEAVRTIIRRFSYVVIPMSILLIRYYPHLGITYEIFSGMPAYCGVTTSKNMLGNISLVSGLVFVWGLIAIYSKRCSPTDKTDLFIHVIFLVLILWLFRLVDSATSFVSLMAAVLVLIVFHLSFIKRILHARKSFILLIPLCCTLYFLAFLERPLTSIVAIIGHETTFWERVQFWPLVIDMMKQDASPLLGVGFQSFFMGTRLQTILQMGWRDCNQAHNGYVEIYLNLGLIGLALLLAVIFSSLANILRQSTHSLSYSGFRMAFLLAALAYNITEAAFDGLHIMWFLFLLIAVDVPRNCATLKPRDPHVFT